MLPSGKPRVKVLYTAIEVSLIFYGTQLGYLHILPTLYLIVVIRSCFLFELPRRLAIALLSFILFLIHQVDYLQQFLIEQDTVKEETGMEDNCWSKVKEFLRARATRTYAHLDQAITDTLTAVTLQDIIGWLTRCFCYVLPN